MAITSVIGQPGLPAAALGGGDGGALAVAQDTIESLRERLRQKEVTMARYEELLEQGSREQEEAAGRSQEELLTLQQTVRSQQAAFNQLRSSKEAVNLTSSSSIGQQVARCQELEDEVAELQASVGQLSGQLAGLRAEHQKLGEVAAGRQQELERAREDKSMEQQVATRQQKDQVERLASEVRAYKQENIMLKDDVARLQSTQAKAPSQVMKSLVEKLRNDLAEKEKKQKALTRAIGELREEMITSAEQTETGGKDRGRTGAEVQKIVDKETKSFQTKIAELQILADKLRKQVRAGKEVESKAAGEVAKLREQLEKKASLVLRLREEKVGQGRAGSRARAREGLEEEREELRGQVQALEEKLRIMNTAEKPYEDEKESKIIKNAEEVAR